MTKFQPFNHNWIQTPFAKDSGGGIHLVFDEHNPEQVAQVISEVDIRDIVYGTSRVQRFHAMAGAGVRSHGRMKWMSNVHAIGTMFDDFLYSVAEHEVIMSYLVPEEYAWEALLHDAPEAYFGDMASPLKRVCKDYRYHLQNFERYIMPEVFGTPAEMSDVVRDFDFRLLWTEALAMFGEPNVNWFGGTHPEPIENVSFRYMRPGAAARAYFDRYEELAAPRREQGLLAPEISFQGVM